MTQVVNNTDKVTYILTTYGLDRVTQALEDRNVNIELTKIKVGNANYEYYEPTESQTSLKSPIINGEFPIVEKDLLEDELTISLHAVIPEDFDNCEIREVGIYETVNGEDKLFAISTQQPFVKPATNLRSFISIDYFAFLKSQNLAEIYDQIVLNPDNQLVTQEDLDNLMITITFTESNLMEQINGNSRVIGLNRAEQLRTKIIKERNDFGYLATYQNYSLLTNAVDPDKIFAYWVFNYPRRTSADVSVVDIAPRGVNLSTENGINTYKRVYNGVTPMLTFDSPNYFYLNQTDPETEMRLTDISTLKDISFTMMFVVEPLAVETKRTLLARSNYAINAHIFEINETEDNALEIKLFTDSSNYLTFRSSANTVPTKAHSIVFTYDAEDKTITSYIKGKKISMAKTVTGQYDGMKNPSSRLYAFSYTDIKKVYADNPTSPTTLLNSDGTVYVGSDWQIENNKILYGENVAVYIASSDMLTDTLYAWVYNDGLTDFKVYTKTLELQANTTLYNENYTVYTGTTFNIVPSGSSYIIQYNGNTANQDPSENIISKTLYCFECNLGTYYIWANSSYNPTALFESDGSVYTGSDWKIENNKVIYQDTSIATYDYTQDIISSALPVTSYVVGTNGRPSQYINSNIGYISVIRSPIKEDQLRCFALTLESAIGNNPCIVTY